MVLLCAPSAPSSGSSPGSCAPVALDKRMSSSGALRSVMAGRRIASATSSPTSSADHCLCHAHRSAGCLLEAFSLFSASAAPPMELVGALIRMERKKGRIFWWLSSSPARCSSLTLFSLISSAMRLRDALDVRASND